MKAVILCGGRGERFWPKSRRALPKQFISLFSPNSLTRETSARVLPLCPLERQLFVAPAEFESLLVWCSRKKVAHRETPDAATARARMHDHISGYYAETSPDHAPQSPPAGQEAHWYWYETVSPLGSVAPSAVAVRSSPVVGVAGAIVTVVGAVACWLMFR